MVFDRDFTKSLIIRDFDDVQTFVDLLLADYLQIILALKIFKFGHARMFY